MHVQLLDSSGKILRQWSRETILAKVLCKYKRNSLHTSQATYIVYRTGAYPGFCIMNQLGLSLLFHRCDASPLKGYAGIQIAGIHLYTWVDTGTVRVKLKCLAQEHNTTS